MAKYNVARPEISQPLDKPYRFIPLTKGQTAIVDVKDFEVLSQFNWCASWHADVNGFYAMRWVGKKSIYMHRTVLGAHAKERVDHGNQNTLDNRRENLRVASASKNGCNRRKQRNNTSGYVGVSWHKRLNKWSSYIAIDGKQKFLGYFTTAVEAAQARDREAEISHGQFGRLNFPA